MTTSIFVDTYTGDIQSKTKKMSRTKVYVGHIKRNSFVLQQMTRSFILYTGLLYNLDNFQTNPKVNDVCLVFGR